MQHTHTPPAHLLQETDLGSLNHLERMDAVNEVRLLVSISHPNVVRHLDTPQWEHGTCTHCTGM